MQIAGGHLVQQLAVFELFVDDFVEVGSQHGAAEPVCKRQATAQPLHRPDLRSR